MSNSNSVLCPDCEQNFISFVKYDMGGLCSSCTQRKSWALRKGGLYIKFKDLPQKMQEKSQQARDYNRAHSIKKKNEKENIQVDIDIKTNNSMSENKKFSRQRIYPDEFYEYVAENANENITVDVLYNQIINKIPNIRDKFTKAFLYKYLYAKKLPYRKLTKEEKDEFTRIGKQKILRKKQENNINESCIDSNNIKSFVNKDNSILDVNLSQSNLPNTENILNTDDISNVNFVHSEKVDNSYNEDLRFAPIVKEVKWVLNTKFNEVGCSLGYDFSVDDYIKAFTVLRYLINNYDTIAKKRNDQWDISNGYQKDIIHEMENTISKPGDTYFQDKCHVLRDIRRGFEIDSKCMELLKPFLISMRDKSYDLTTLINKLTTQKEKKDDFKYVPNVDKTMVAKYDWAQEDNPCKGKLMQKTLLSTNSKNNKKDGKPVFIASCYLSGGGYGIFKKWVKEVSYDTLEEAKKAIDIELDDIQRKNKNILVTEFEIHRKN